MIQPTEEQIEKMAKDLYTVSHPNLIQVESWESTLIELKWGYKRMANRVLSLLLPAVEIMKEIDDYDPGFGNTDEGVDLQIKLGDVLAALKKEGIL